MGSTLKSEVDVHPGSTVHGGGFNKPCTTGFVDDFLHSDQVFVSEK